MQPRSSLDAALLFAALAALCVVAWLWGVRSRRRLRLRLRLGEQEKQRGGDGDATERPLAFPPVEPLPEFRWEDTEPIQIRPLKPHYHLTMAIENISANDLLVFDNTYKARLEGRRRIIQDHYSTVIGAADGDNAPERRGLATTAVTELYTWLMTTYLPTRYPRLFQLVPPTSSAEKGEQQERQQLLNTATSAVIPCRPDPSAPVEDTLQTLGHNLDEEFLFLLPAADGDGYALEAFVTCYPNGFDTSKKRGLKLRDIHKPVPGYKEKLERSMDRFFDRLEVGRYVKRVNWSITTDGELFAGRGGHHLYEGDEVVEEDVDLSQTYFRCERQTLHKLPQSGAIVFAFKTYLYPIRQLKDEGLGEALADAIDGLKTGSTPAISFYKKAPVWAPAVTRYLRS